MSESHSAPTPQRSPPKARNPVEKLLVRGLIVGLLVLVAIEGIGWNSHKTAVGALSKKVKAVEDDGNAPEVTEKDVKDVLGGKQPVRTEQYPTATNGLPASKKLEVYSWFTFHPSNKRELWVHYAKKGMKDDGPATVVFVSTDDQDAKPVEPIDAPTPSAGGPGPGAMGGGMPQGMGPPGGGGGRGRPGPASHDPDKPNVEADAGAKTEGATTEEPKTNADQGDDKKPEPETEKTDAKPESGQE